MKLKYFIKTFGCPALAYLSPFQYYSYTAQGALRGGRADY